MVVDRTNGLFMMTVALTSKLVLHFLLMEITESLRCCYSHSTNEITEKEVPHRCPREIFVVCFNNLEIILDRYINTRGFLSLMSIDMSYFGQFCRLRDIDKHLKRYIEKEKLESLLDILIFSCLCQESKNKGRVSENVLKYCDVDTDVRLSKTQLDGFLSYMKNMKSNYSWFSGSGGQ